MGDAESIKIVFSDVDGTFVDEEHHPIPESGATIRAVAERVPICLVSARSPEGLYPIQQALGFNGPLACYSGAYVLDEEGNELLSSTIPLADALEIKAYLERELPHITVGTYGFHTWIVDSRSDPRILREEYLVMATSKASRDLASEFGERGVHKFLLMGEPADILQAQQMVSERFPHLTAVRSSDILCEVMAGDVSKSRAVRLLCERYGVTPAQAVAFGDGQNDIDMMSAVEQSYAMANAEPEVKLAATHEVPWTNAESGVARMLEQLLLD